MRIMSERCAAFAAILLGSILAMPSKSAWAQDGSIYLVKAFSCPFVTQRMSTGFTVSGIQGIVTALHGVAGCKEIEAEHDQTLVKSLQVSEVDVRNDIALLTSPEFSPDAPLTPNPTKSWRAQDSIQITGHPEGIESLTTTLSLRKPPTARLSGLLPDKLRPKFESRKSPDPAITVLSMQGTLVAGYSGAPVLDATSKLIGVADGGLEGGLSQITWAIPWYAIQLKSAIGDTLLSKIVAQDPSGLISFNTNLPPVFPIRARQEDTGKDSIGEGRHMSTEITISRSGSVDAVTRIHNDVWLSGFCGKVAVWLSDKDGNVVYHGAMPEAEGLCVTARVWGRNDKSNTWSQTIPLAQLNEVRAVSLLQTTGSRNPFEYIQENLSLERTLRIVAPVK
jgi:hypothetical protein